MRSVLPREEVVKAIEHKKPVRVPMMIHQWNWAGTHGDQAWRIEEIQREYPNDVYFIGVNYPRRWDETQDPNHIPGYSWMHLPPPPPSEEVHGHDANVAITDWAMLPDVLANWPSPDQVSNLFGTTREDVAKGSQGRYTGLNWWGCLYEPLWGLRGMENVLCDFYEHPNEVHQLLDAFTDFHCAVIRRAGKEIGLDSAFTSDDIGMQTGPMFSPKIFKEFFKPRYERLFRAAHESGMHFWLHMCGCVTPFLDDFIEIGLDVVHPIQKYTMDEREIAQKFGGKLAFWAGMDVQQVLPWGKPEDVRREVRFMIDTYDRPDGGCMITVGNGVTPDIPIDNLFAFYDETYNYGVEHRSKFK